MSRKKEPIHVKLIANPGAGKMIGKAAQIEQVMDHFVDLGLDVDVALAHPKKEAIPITRRAIKDGYDAVIAMGGDGTIGSVITGIMGSKSKTPMGIISAGTSNDFARSLGIPEDLREACELIASGHTRKVDLGQIRTRKTKKFYVFMVTAVGLTATIYPMIKEIPEGKFGGIKEAAATLLKYNTKPKVYLTLDDDSKIEVETMLVTIANTPLIGLKNLLAPDAILDDGLLDIAVYPGFSKAELLSYFAMTANERSIPDGKIQRYQARKIKIKTSPKLDVAAEGIILGKGTAWIKTLPRVLRVLAPEPGAGAEKTKEVASVSIPA